MPVMRSRIAVLKCLGSNYPPMALSGGQTFAGYRIVRLVGSGGMGEVCSVPFPASLADELAAPRGSQRDGCATDARAH
jgi:hypothetical protein